ncbi:hypothetical protein [Sporosalibacterium faouarense]|uniref:hypothetical protein n=1 Tax=Sporosalibacterium faouarense TaxID=516123 RepID=UPI00141D6C65|nr:hypothetical protein [Sporosalibacterium faouarense]MTI47042.1 hypothetical protein [Bacillota bacterium]
MSQELSKAKTKTSTEKFECTSCGGDMIFNPKTQSLSCLYCGNKVEIEQKDDIIQEYDINSSIDEDSSDWGSETRVIHCNDCGAETVMKENSVAQFCAFCGSSHIIKQDEIPGIKPESLIPFKITRKEAKGLFSKWLKGKFYAPKKAKSNNKMDRLLGVYIPYWTYDSDTHSNYSAERGTYYYVNETHVVYRDGERKEVTRRVRKTRWRHVSGSYDLYFDDLLVNASQHVDSKIIEEIEPFNLEELEHYEPEYLSGFTAERYAVELEEGWEAAKQAIHPEIYKRVVREIGGDTVRNVRIDTNFNSILFKHILLPVWMSSFKYKEKVYRFMINGQTGEVQGESPVSALKIILTILIVLCIAAGGFWFIQNGR